MDDPKVEFLNMQIEIVLSILSQEVAYFYAYKTPFGCTDTKIRTGVDMKPILLTKVACYVFLKFIR
jgi:hypothetical protein